MKNPEALEEPQPYFNLCPRERKIKNNEVHLIVKEYMLQSSSSPKIPNKQRNGEY